MGGLFSSSNSRIMTNEEVRNNLTSDQFQALHRVFNTLKRNDAMSLAVFRRTFLPSNTPVLLSEKLYGIYAISHSSKELSFDDFAELYYLLKVQRDDIRSSPNRRAILCFYFFKQHAILDPKQAQNAKGAMEDSFDAALFVYVGTQYFGMQEYEVVQFLNDNNIKQLGIQVTLQTFIQMYERNREHILFSWFCNLSKDYLGTINGQFDPEGAQVQLSARTSPSTRKEIQQQNGFNAKMSQNAQKTPIVISNQKSSGTDLHEKLFPANQTKVLHNLFHDKLVKKADLKDSLKVLSDLFEDMNLPPLLERRIIESFLYASETNYFEWKCFMGIMGILTKQSNDSTVIFSYIFDIFAKYKPVILKEQLLQVAELFMDSESQQLRLYLQQCETLKKAEFIKLCERVGLKLHYFAKISTLFEIEFGMQNIGAERELEVIRIALDGEMDLKDHFQSHLARSASEDKFYVLNKGFWQKWCAYVGLPRKDSFGQLERLSSMGSSQEVKNRRPHSIQNEVLKMSQFQGRLKQGLLYGKDYVIVPARVWRAFTNWYGRSFELRRQVIIYPIKDLSLRSATQSILLQSQKGGGNQLNESQIVKSLDQLIVRDEANGMVRELEIDEIFIRCGRIQDNGKIPQNGLRDGAFSRKSTLQFVLDKLIGAFENKQTQTEKSKPARVWIGDEGPITGESELPHTLEELGLRCGDKVYIEFMLESREWPSSKVKVDKGQTDATRTKGCANLGNTCYMNSAMQCIANSPYIRDFFTGVANNAEQVQAAATASAQTEADSATTTSAASKKHPPYKYQVNPNNVMGHQGDFVMPFAETMCKMWDSGAIFSVYPWGFKGALGKVNEQFQGRRQHDSHEFMICLMDSLHEELNVRQKKPYIESPEFRKDMKRVSDEFWANFLRRNWSFMVFIFYGQTKSLIKCDTCHTVKVNYSIFSNISLPLPNSNTLLLPIVVQQIPSELTAILKRHMDIALMEQMGDAGEPALRRGVSMAVMDRADEFVTRQSKRERAILINLMIDQGQTIAQLLDTVQQMRGINMIGKLRIGERDIELTKPLLYVQKDAKKQAVTLLFEEKFTLEEIGVMDRQPLIITEVLTETAKQIIQQHYVAERNEKEEFKGDDDSEDKDTSLMRSHLDYTVRNPRFTNSNHLAGSTMSLFMPSSKVQSQNSNFNEDADSIANTEYSMIETRQVAAAAKAAEPKRNTISTQQYFNIFYKNKVPPVDLLPNYIPPSELVIMVFNRRLLIRSQNERLIKKFDPQLFGVQFPILATAQTSRRELYEQVWARVRAQLEHKCHDRRNLWWNRDTKIPNYAPGTPKKPLSPFVLKHVDMTGLSCSICHWSKRCHGCPIEPRIDDQLELKPLLLRNTYIACEWDIHFFTENSDPQGATHQEHESVGKMQAELDKPQSLQSCLDLHQKVDSISVNCERCKKNRPSKKSGTIQVLPPVLILHLKRFRMTSYQVVKMQNMVTYPLYDLDMTEFVSFTDPHTCYLYDLFGVVNHFGTMGGGHYTATVKNERTGEWLHYDDSSVKQTAECDVVARSAYILFYRRKDLTQKPMSAVVPRLNKSYFPGMPVKLRSGQECFLMEYREGHPCPLVLGLGEGIVIYCKESDVVADPDSEDLSSINNMFKAKKKSDYKVLEQEAEQKGTSRPQNKPKDKERDCSIF